MVVKEKEYFEKTNLKNTFYEEKEMQDIKIDFYLIKRNPSFII